MRSEQLKMFRSGAVPGTDSDSTVRRGLNRTQSATQRHPRVRDLFFYIYYLHMNGKKTPSVAAGDAEMFPQTLDFKSLHLFSESVLRVIVHNYRGWK